MRGFVVVLVAVGCGPQVAVSAGETGTTSVGESTAATSGAIPSGASGMPTTTMPPPPTTTGSEDGTGTTTALATTGAADLADSGEDMCGCESMPVELNTVVDRGYSAAELLEAVASTTLDFTWLAIEGQPQTTLQVDVTYEGGAIEYGLGGCCGNFLCVPCLDGHVIPVFARVTSADGLLDEYVPAETGGSIVEGGVVDGTYMDIPISGTTGTLDEQTFVSRRRPVELENFFLRLSWAPWQSDLVEPWAVIGAGGVTVGESQL